MKKIYLFPNLITSANFFCGIISLTLTLDGKFGYAALAIMIGVFFDLLDGPIARWNKATSKFGIEYDSLSDLVTFGVAPMVLAYRMELYQLGGRVGLGIAFLYSVCAALRLARYNTQSKLRPRKYFKGLPTPGAAGFLASYLLLIQYHEVAGIYLKYMPVLMIVTSYLMVSNVPYPSAVNAQLLVKKPFIYLVMALLLVAGMILFIHEALFLSFAIFVVRGPMRRLSKRLEHRSLLELEPQEDLKRRRKLR